eukprot:CAMPEP_0175457566 /NCGR_PEP_ID=MMETSP0095-20121207/66132_1 /TAXON_ID=311494 /ORGANISM="Alexandrium monilatum, Strain CCMP3105" /LENGTH=41 /DNA_ID= /DNA_START= /DNA_END= /DNA_ORIENTATION=
MARQCTLRKTCNGQGKHWSAKRVSGECPLQTTSASTTSASA